MTYLSLRRGGRESISQREWSTSESGTRCYARKGRRERREGKKKEREREREREGKRERKREREDLLVRWLGQDWESEWWVRKERGWNWALKIRLLMVWMVVSESEVSFIMWVCNEHRWNFFSLSLSLSCFFFLLFLLVNRDTRKGNELWERSNCGAACCFFFRLKPEDEKEKA